MSFMSNYRKALKKLEDEDEEKSIQTPGKKTTTTAKKSSAGSFMDNYRTALNTLQEEEEKKSISDRMTAGSLTSGLKKEEEEDGIFDGWFKKSESESIAKAILGTGSDILSDIGTGIVGMGERVVDAFANIAPYSLLSQNEFGYLDPNLAKKQQEIYKKATKGSDEFVKKDLYDEEKVAKKIIAGLGSASYMGNIAQNGGQVTAEDLKLSREMTKGAQKYLDDEMEKDSVLDEKSDSLVQSAGQLLGTSALAAMGIPADVVIGLTSYGGEVENALNQGASHEEAGLSAAVSAGAEILTEKISGGIKFGGKTLDDFATKWLARNVSNKVGRTLAKMGMDMVGEGAEEVLSGIMGAVGQKMTYMEEKELKELFTKEDAWEAFIGGAALGAGGSAIQTVNSAVEGRDAVTDLTKNEQKVIDKVFKDEIAKAEKKGKLTEKQKAKLYDEVLEDMEKGYISTDTIEEVLGGESYDRYKKASEWESSLQQEFDDLGKKENPTLADQRRYAELDSQLRNVKATSNLGQMKAQLQKDVYEMTKGDRLVESYFENVRSKQKYEADLTKYEGKARDIIKQVMDSGLADNSNQTHEFWDMAAKMSADRDTTISIATQDEILNMVKEEYEAEGKTFDASKFKGVTIDGYASKNGIVLNAQTKRALNFVVGHEITHTLEQSNQYKDLQKILFDYAKDEYKTRYQKRAGQYENIYSEDGYKEKIDKEVAADMVGDILFSDKDFVKHLSTQNRNVFQKMWDEVKYLCKVATAGSKEARQLEKVKKAFEDAYREAGKEQGESKFSVSDKNIKDISTGYGYGETYYTMSYTQDGKVVATLEYGEYDGQPNVKMIEVEPEYRRKGIATKLMQELQRKYPDTEIDFGMSTPDGSKLLDSITYDVTDETVVADRQKLKDLQAELDELQEKLDILYDTENLTEEQDAELHRLGDRWQEVYESIFKMSEDLRGKKATRTFVKTDADVQFSVSEKQNENYLDAVNRGDTDTAQRMVDEAAKNAGYDIKAYHGTKDSFTVFKGGQDNQYDSGYLGSGFYFTDKRESAEDYSEWKKGYGKKRVMDSALRMTNPLVIEDTNKPHLIAVQEALGLHLTDDNFMARPNKQISDAITAEAKKQGYDGIIRYSEFYDETTYVVFDSEQVKSADPVTYDDNGNVIPLSKRFNTENPDIRFSLSEDSDGRAVSPAVAKRFGNSKAVDENGNLKVLYHGTASGEFSVFDKAKGSVEGDFGSGFYFTDNEADVSEHYEGGGPDFDNKVGRRADEIWGENPDMEYEEAEELARKELFKGSHKFEVYLNIENPAIVGETTLFDNESYLEQYDEEDYEDYDEYIADVEQLLADDIENIVWEVEKNVDVYSTDGLADVLYNAYFEGGIGIEELKAKINDLYLEDSNGNLVGNEVARQIIESLGYDGIIDPTVSGKWNMNMEEGTTHYIVFKPNQIKAVTNQNPTDNPDINLSISNEGETHNEYGRWNVYSKYTAPVASVSETESVAPGTNNPADVANNPADVAYNPADADTLFPDDLSPVQDELERLEAERDQIYSGLETAVETGSAAEVGQLAEEYDSITARIRELESGENQRADSLTDEDAPPEMEAPLSMRSENYDPFAGIGLHEISRSTRSYSDRNPGARHFFEEGALGFLYDVNNSTHGERWYNDQLYYESGGEKGFGGTSRVTTADIADLKDTYGYTWDELRKAAQKVADGDFRSVAAKRVEYLVHKRMMEGYTDVDGRPIPANQEYISYLNETFANEQRQGGVFNLLQNAGQYDPEGVAPLKPTETALGSKEVKGQQTYITTEDKLKGRRVESGVADAPLYDSKDKTAVRGQQTMFEPPKPNPKVASVLTEATRSEKKSGVRMGVVSQTVDKGMAVENLAYKTGNTELQGEYQAALPSTTEAKAQYFMENGADGVKPFKNIVQEITESGKRNDFENYMYHLLNIDRMTLDERFGLENKMVFGETITADVSRKEVAEYEAKNPAFKQWAEEIYGNLRYMRNMLVEGDLASQETADLWEKEYPHYVPIRRVDSAGQNISVPLDTNKTGVNAPIQRATGGNSDIEPLLNTIAQRIEQTYRAIARNEFGIELKNTLGTTLNSQKNFATPDEVIDTIDAQDDHLLKPGTQTSNPTFTVFENGERVEFEITEELFDALKPAGKILGHRFESSNKAVVRGVGKALEARRNLLTNWNPVFAWYRNPIKDIQDVAVNSQHPMSTYLSMPRAVIELATNGKMAQEYHANGGKSNTYYDSRKNEFVKKSGLKKLFGWYEAPGEFIEEIPRLSEYIASRNGGRSVKRSMLDAARVTTNFSAGGDFTKFLNSHGFTFLNASVQGASQHVRNFRESYHAEGVMGTVKTLAKYIVAGVPAVIWNHLKWDDDEEYEELNDYVKQNYFVLWKTADGKFVRIPKGRTTAVMSELMSQMENLVTGDDEADFGTFFELFMNNIAPNNPLENNVIAPIGQVMSNTAWYGGDLIPSRLQDLPAAEQFDESTDYISKWLGEKTNTSPYKWNYLIDQYSGGLGDVFLPMLTPEAESGDNSALGNFIAPWKKELTTDMVLNNKNPGDFYDLKDELEKLSNSRNATEEDTLKSLYMDSVNWEMGDLYAQKREIQSGDLPDDEKYEAVREIQEQINALAKKAVGSYEDIHIDGKYATVGDKRFDYSDYGGKWYEISGEYLEREQAAMERYGITESEYWNDTDLYYKADWYFDDKYATVNREKVANLVFGGKRFAPYAAELGQIKGEDKDGDGKTDSGTKKDNIIDYINDSDLDFGERIITFKMSYPADDTYNMEIIDYLNGREDISYQQMESILKYLGFNVDSKGRISWD